MTTFLYTHPACLAHDTGDAHPESSARLRAILSALDAPHFAMLIRKQARLATQDELLGMHSQTHLDAVFSALPSSGLASIDDDTRLCSGSGEAALRAAGAVLEAIDSVVAGDADNAFCAVRPPGHHAEPDRVMGFCLFNNVAVGAAHARRRHGLRRIAVVDFDVHHGNGTEAMFRDDPDLFYASTHQRPLYPGTGDPCETGVAGNIVNVSLAPSAGSEIFRTAYVENILPALEKFSPELLLVSAGFDAHARDPLGQVNLDEDDYIWVTEKMMDIADKTCKGRLVSVLEGGYDLHALAQSTAAHIRCLMTCRAVPPPLVTV